MLAELLLKALTHCPRITDQPYTLNPKTRYCCLGAQQRMQLRLRQHTAAYVSISQHTSSYVEHVSIRQHTAAYVIIRQHTAAYGSIRQHTSSYVEYVSIRQHTSAYAAASAPLLLSGRAGAKAAADICPAFAISGSSFESVCSGIAGCFWLSVGLRVCNPQIWLSVGLRVCNRRCTRT